MRRLILISFGVLALGLFGLASLSLVAAQNQTAKGLVEGMLQDILSSEGRKVVVDDVSIAIDGGVSARRIELHDDAGAWLVIGDLALDWQPLSLLSDSLQIDRLAVGRIAVSRLPQSAEVEEEQSAAPEELSGLTNAEIKVLDIERLEIAESLAGEAFVLKVSGAGKVTQTPPEVTFDFEARRTNGGDSELTASVLLEPASRQLKLDLRLKEQARGLVVRLLDIVGEPAVDLAVKANGTIDQWASELILKLDQTTAFKGTAAIDTIAAGKRLTLDAGGNLARLSPENLSGLLGGEAQLVGSVLFHQSGGTANVERIRIANDALQLRASGPLDWSGATTDLSIELRTETERPLVVAKQAANLGAIRVAGLTGDVHVTGSMATPDWKFTARAAQLATDLATLQQPLIEIAGHGLDPAADKARVDGVISAIVEDTGDNDVLKSLAGPFRADLVARSGGDGHVMLDGTRIVAGDLNAAFSGHLIPGDGGFDIGFDASANAPQTGQAVLDGLLVGDVKFTGKVAKGRGNAVRLTGWNLTSETLSATVSGTAGDLLDLAVAAELLDLSQLEPKVSGRARLEAKLTGQSTAPDLALTATGDDMQLAGEPLVAPKLKAQFKLDERAPQGRFDLTAELRGKPVSARGEIATSADGIRELRGLDVVSGAARLAGGLRLPLNGAPSGRLELSAPDLADLAPFLLTQMSGSLDAEIDLEADDERSNLRATFTGSQVSSPDFAAGRLTGDIAVDDVFGRPKLKGDASAQRVRAGGVSFDSIATAALSKGVDGYTVTLDADGRDLSARAEADVMLRDQRTDVTVTRLDGSAEGVAYAIAAPFVVSRNAAGAVEVTDAKLQVGSGRIEITGKVAPDLDTAVAISNLPLAPFERLAGVPGLSGLVDGKAAFKGKPAAATGTYELAVRNLVIAELSAQGVPAASLDVSGTVQRGKIGLRGTATAGSDLSASFEGTVETAGQTRFDIRATGSAQARGFANRIAETGARLDGKIAFNVLARGTPQQPQVDGSITLSGATFGDVDGKFIVQNATGRIEFASDVVRIVSLKGRTGRKGTASISGTIGLAAPQPADIRIRIDRGVYVDGTLVNTGYDADLRLTGPLATAPLVRGEIRLRKTKITLSEVPPTALRPLDVRHRAAPAKVARQLQAIQARSAGGSSNLRLDVRVVTTDSIAVTGRGLNALLGGKLTITGTAAAPVANGSFRLRRGILKLLARRLEFESGRLDFVNDLDPRINLVAVSRGSDATIRLVISGRITEPKISVTSSPELPEEEALSRLVFDRSMVELSPLQIAQLASSIAVLSGGGGGGVLDGLQGALGVDWLEITQTPAGETAVGVGKQINDRLSVGVEQSTRTNTSRVIIDLNLTKSLKLRGSAGTDGASRAGVFFQKDY